MLSEVFSVYFGLACGIYIFSSSYIDIIYLYFTVWAMETTVIARWQSFCKVGYAKTWRWNLFLLKEHFISTINTHIFKNVLHCRVFNPCKNTFSPNVFTGCCNYFGQDPNTLDPNKLEVYRKNTPYPACPIRHYGEGKIIFHLACFRCIRRSCPFRNPI